MGFDTTERLSTLSGETRYGNESVLDNEQMNIIIISEADEEPDDLNSNIKVLSLRLKVMK